GGGLFPELAGNITDADFVVMKCKSRYRLAGRGRQAGGKNARAALQVRRRSRESLVDERAYRGFTPAHGIVDQNCLLLEALPVRDEALEVKQLAAREGLRGICRQGRPDVRHRPGMVAPFRPSQ